LFVNSFSFDVVDTTHCHLWMFLFDILLDSNKSNVATWEDQKGMFRIRDPTRLAEMWGEKRNRTNMTYEKLSRSLRHYYEKKILRKVPKRKYTYKFNSREILKSYEVQPFYRRSASSSQAQRNAASQGNQAQMNVYQASPSSGQCSPYYSPVTPSPSYHQHHGFNWNHVQPLPQSWSMSMDSSQMCHQQAPNGYQVPTSISTHGKQWPQPMQFGFQCRPAEQPMAQSPMPATPVHLPQPYNAGIMQQQQPSPVSSSYQENGSFLNDLHASASPASLPDIKPNLSNLMENIDNIIGKTKMCTTRANSLPITTDSSATYSAAHNDIYNQNNSNSTQITQSRCRSHSVNSYESSSPDSFYSNDVMFNDIMESLVMEAF